MDAQALVPSFTRGPFGGVVERLRDIPRRFEAFLIPDDMLATGELDEGVRQRRRMRLVGIIAGVSVVLFVPELALAKVPSHLWLPYMVSVVVAVGVIGWGLLIVPKDSRFVPMAVLTNALMVSWLGLFLGDHLHQMALLYGVVVAGHTSIHGIRAGMIMVVLGAFLVPLTITVRLGVSLVDFTYAFVYLFGIAIIPFLHIRLREKGLGVVRRSASKYRDLVEHVPAIVYTARAGVEGECEYVSPSAEEILGFPPESWTSDAGFWMSRVHPDDRDRMVAHWSRHIDPTDAGSTSVEYRMIDAEGRVHWLRDRSRLLDPLDDAADPAEDGDSSGPTRWTGFLTDVTAQKELEEQLQYQAFHDPLTGLPNRALFADRLGQALARADRRSDESLAVLFLDVDDFKTINDGIGHEAGDELLVMVARTLRSCIRPMDTAARLGGDEFAILLQDQAEASASKDVADRILEALRSPIVIGGREIVIGATIGIANLLTGHETALELMRNADAAMYAAKRQGKGRHETFAPKMQAAVARRLELAGEMRRGVERGEFTVHYQPIVRLDDGTIDSLEALVRWRHPRRGLVLPGEFIPEAEENGQVTAIGRFVLEQSCREARAWHDAIADGTAPALAVNVSARQFRDPALPGLVVEALSQTGLDASALTLEITETTIMEDTDTAIERLQHLKDLGVRLAIDDFGTGYSSLSYLRRLPVDILKVDKSFVDDIGAGGQALALARVIVSIGQTLHLDTVAEGVEGSAQAAALTRLGCEVAQGFHFARPLPPGDVIGWLADHRGAFGIDEGSDGAAKRDPRPVPWSPPTVLSRAASTSRP
jgi:diguanylate cyclase (GGDEF)-like protein/PAS domain S-box-containing protein